MFCLLSVVETELNGSSPSSPSLTASLAPSSLLPSSPPHPSSSASPPSSSSYSPPPSSSFTFSPSSAYSPTLFPPSTTSTDPLRQPSVEADSSPSSPYGSDDSGILADGDKKRSQLSRSESHLASEKRRRANINDGFEMLRNVVPNCQPCHSKAEILKRAALYIKTLVEKQTSTSSSASASSSASPPPSSASATYSALSAAFSPALLRLDLEDEAFGEEEEDEEEQDMQHKSEFSASNPSAALPSSSSEIDEVALLPEGEAKKKLHFAIKYAEKLRNQRDAAVRERDLYKETLSSLTPYFSTLPHVSAPLLAPKTSPTLSPSSAPSSSSSIPPSSSSSSSSSSIPAVHHHQQQPVPTGHPQKFTFTSYTFPPASQASTTTVMTPTTTTTTAASTKSQSSSSSSSSSSLPRGKSPKTPKVTPVERPLVAAAALPVVAASSANFTIFQPPPPSCSTVNEKTLQALKRKLEASSAETPLLPAKKKLAKEVTAA